MGFPGLTQEGAQGNIKAACKAPCQHHFPREHHAGLVLFIRTIESVWLGRDLQYHLVPPPCHWLGHFTRDQVAPNSFQSDLGSSPEKEIFLPMQMWSFTPSCHMTHWPLSEVWDIAVTMSPVRWQQGVTRPSCSPCLADGTPTPVVNQQMISSAPLVCQAGAGSQNWIHPSQGPAWPGPGVTPQSHWNCRVPWVTCSSNQPWRVFSKLLFLK